MMAKVVFCVLSVIQVFVDASSFWDRYIEPTSAVLSITTNYVDSCAQRGQPGFICMECTVLARCVLMNNVWHTIPLEACDTAAGMHCNPNEQRCSANPGPCNPDAGGNGLFSCSSVGVFPDPFNCQAYHMCFPSLDVIVSVAIHCGGNQAFDPNTSLCSKDLGSNVCQGNQFTCTTVGQMGPWLSNPNIYYICMASTSGGNRILFPDLFRCPVGEVFRGGSCNVDNGVDGSGFVCQRPGLFADDTNCRAYFFCDGNLRSQHIVCPTGTYFNPISLGCLRGTC